MAAAELIGLVAPESLLARLTVPVRQLLVLQRADTQPRRVFLGPNLVSLTSSWLHPHLATALDRRFCSIFRS
jgi:hypothetical protein